MLQKLIISLVICSCPFYLIAQSSNLSYNQSNNFNKKIILQKPGHLYSNYVTKTGITKTKDIDLTEMLDIIVEFKDKPLFIKPVQNKEALEKVTYQNTFDQFSRDLSSLNQKSSARLKVSLNAPEFKRQYYKVFFGVSLRATRVLREAIRSLSYVKKIYNDYTVKALTDSNNIIIKSGKKIENDTATGKGVIVGIIDTGIDYKHPALGGGIGPGYKVIGGYNFIKNNDDPMDDNGHGTHVAGIIAAKSDSVTGLAPNASLMAFKVLDAYGGGTESTVLAGIERAVDPNNNETPNEKVDIVNMSLGGPGNSGDPLSTAVDNATSLGVTFCIAAGNSGDYNTIGSPGTAVSAITVGASDESGKVANFSSMGPDNNNYSIKPEVIAPGVNIISTYLDSSYATLSGTSMAAPYVSGVCALIKSIHPDWRPELIKSAIVNTADNTFADIMAQGSGRIDKQVAEKTTTFAYPAVISFGLDYAKQSPWIVRDTIEITNKADLNQDYTLSISGLQPGITLNAVPSSFTLPPGGSQKIIFTLAINNNAVQYLETGSRAYSGNVYITGTQDYIHLPWAFIKSPILVVNFDIPPVDILILNNNSYFGSEQAYWSNDSLSAQIMASNGTYNILTDYETTPENNELSTLIVIKTGIKINDFDTLSISSSEAKNRIILNGVSENGTLLSSLNKTLKNYTIRFPDSLSVRYYFTYNDYPYQYLVSNLPDGYTIYAGQFQSDLKTENVVRLVQFDKVSNVDQDIILTNSISNFIKENIHISLPVNEKSQNFCFPFGTMLLSYTNGFTFGVGLFIYHDLFYPSVKEWDGILYTTPEKDSLIFYTTCVTTDMFDSSYSFPGFESPSFRANSDSLGLYDGKPTSGTLFFHNNGQINLGKGLAFPIFYETYTGQNIYGIAWIDIYGQLNEWREADAYLSEYSLYDNKGNLLQSGNCSSNLNLPLKPGNYNFKIINNHYYIDSTVEAISILNDKFTFKYPGTYLPNITSMQLRNSKNEVISKAQKNEKIILYFSIFDSLSSNLTLTKAYAKNYYKSEWQQIALTPILYDNTIGHYYKGDLSGFTNSDTSAIDLKIVSTDLTKDTMEYTLQPAFIVGNFTGGITGILKTDPLITSSVLYNNYPNPFNPGTYISYSIPEASYVKIEIFNILGQKVAKIFEGNQAKGQYKFYWDAQKFSSGIYFCNYTATGKVNYQKINKLILLK